MSRLDRRVEQLRMPPQSIEAEQAVLGGVMLTDGEAAKEVGDVVTPADFYRRDHQLIFQAILELADRGDCGIDAVTVGEWFEARGLAEQVAGGAYLIELASTTPSAANIRAYAQIVRDKALLRAGIEAGTAFVDDCFQPEGRDTEEIIASGAGRLAALTARGAQANSGLRLVRGHLKGAWDDLQTRYQGTVTGLPLPYANARRYVPALDPGDLMYLAARPSMGKTAMAMEIALEAAMQHGRHVAVFSMEMTAGQLTTRGLSRLARVPMDRLRAPQGLEDEDWSRLHVATGLLRDLSLAIDDTAGQTIDTITTRTHRMHAKVEGGLGLVVLDYVQLIEGSGRDEKRNDELTRISRGLKRLAKDLGCPVIALSQLNRSLETRTDKRPVMADLRESGSLEQDADVVAFLYRDDYYSKEACAAPGVAELIIGKNRNGPTGTAYLSHELACSSFADWSGTGRPRYVQEGEGGAKGQKRTKRAGYGGPAERELPAEASP